MIGGSFSRRLLRSKPHQLRSARLARFGSASAPQDSTGELAKECRSFANAVLKPVAAKIDTDCAFPSSVLREMYSRKLLGVDVPTDFGGRGRDALSYCIAIEEISRGCASSGILMCSAKFFSNPILLYGTEEQKRKYVPACMTGEVVGCGMMSEPGCGSDAAAMTTRVAEEGDCYVLNGEKAWVNGDATHGTVFATADPSLRAKGISAFLVDMTNPGIILGPKKAKLGQRGLSMANVTFKDCRIPKDALLGERGRGFYIAMSMLDSGRLGIAANALGIAQASLDCALEYSKTRHAFGSPISSLYAIQSKLADMSCRIDSARLLLHHAAALKDRGLPYGKQSSQAKLLASQTASFCAHEAIQTLGALGYVGDAPAERHYRDARATELIEGTSEVLRMIIAGYLVKEKPE